VSGRPLTDENRGSFTCRLSTTRRSVRCELGHQPIGERLWTVVLLRIIFSSRGIPNGLDVFDSRIGDLIGPRSFLYRLRFWNESLSPNLNPSRPTQPHSCSLSPPSCARRECISSCPAYSAPGMKAQRVKTRRSRDFQRSRQSGPDRQGDARLWPHKQGDGFDLLGRDWRLHAYFDHRPRCTSRGW
jgi:hypothetical protein